MSLVLCKKCIEYLEELTQLFWSFNMKNRSLKLPSGHICSPHTARWANVLVKMEVGVLQRLLGLANTRSEVWHRWVVWFWHVCTSHIYDTSLFVCLRLLPRLKHSHLALLIMSGEQNHWLSTGAPRIKPEAPPPLYPFSHLLNEGHSETGVWDFSILFHKQSE